MEFECNELASPLVDDRDWSTWRLFRLDPESGAEIASMAVQRPDDAESLYEDLVEQLGRCTNFVDPNPGEPNDSVSGIIIGESEPLEELGDEALRFDAQFGEGFYC